MTTILHVLFLTLSSLVLLSACSAKKTTGNIPPETYNQEKNTVPTQSGEPDPVVDQSATLGTSDDVSTLDADLQQFTVAEETFE